jgi:hypothetical protein
MNKIILVMLLIISLLILISSIGLFGLITFSFMGGCYITDYPAEKIDNNCIQISEENSCVPYMVRNNCDENYVILSEGLAKEQEIIIEKGKYISAIPKINPESTPPWKLIIVDKVGNEIIIKGKTNYEKIENKNKLEMFYYSLIIISILSLMTFFFSLFKLVKTKKQIVNSFPELSN